MNFGLSCRRKKIEFILCLFRCTAQNDNCHVMQTQIGSSTECDFLTTSPAASELLLNAAQICDRDGASLRSARVRGYISEDLPCSTRLLRQRSAARWHLKKNIHEVWWSSFLYLREGTARRSLPSTNKNSKCKNNLVSTTKEGEGDGGG